MRVPARPPEAPLHALRVTQGYSDDPRVFNGVMPYAQNFETGWLVFWQLRMTDFSPFIDWSFPHFLSLFFHHAERWHRQKLPPTPPAVFQCSIWQYEPLSHHQLLTCETCQSQHRDYFCLSTTGAFDRAFLLSRPDWVEDVGEWTWNVTARFSYVDMHVDRGMTTVAFPFGGRKF